MNLDNLRILIDSIKEGNMYRVDNLDKDFREISKNVDKECLIKLKENIIKNIFTDNVYDIDEIISVLILSGIDKFDILEFYILFKHGIVDYSFLIRKLNTKSLRELEAYRDSISEDINIKDTEKLRVNLLIKNLEGKDTINLNMKITDFVSKGRELYKRR